MFRQLAIIFISVLCFCSCDRDDSWNKTINLDQTNYFPLQIGNVWIYQDDETIEITAKEVIDGIEYFKFESSRGSRYSEYYRQDNNGNIYLKRGGCQEILIFVLNNNFKETWETICDEPIYYKISTLENKNDILQLGSCDLKGCFKYSYDHPQIADDRHSIWLAPGIGIVKSESTDWGTSNEVKSIKINGVAINF